MADLPILQMMAAQMVNVGEKAETRRTAIAGGQVVMSPDTLQTVKSGGLKGDVLSVAQLAGIMGANRPPS